MTDRELMQQALAVLEGLADSSWSEAFKQRKYDSDEPQENVQRECVLGAIAALRERLREPEMQVIDEMAEAPWDKLRERLAQPEPAPGYCPHCKQYTIEEPMRREWVGLTDDEIAVICGECAASAHRTDDISYARAIEAKLKEKNNG